MARAVARRGLQEARVAVGVVEIGAVVEPDLYVLVGDTGLLAAEFLVEARDQLFTRRDGQVQDLEQGVGEEHLVLGVLLVSPGVDQ